MTELVTIRVDDRRVLSALSALIARGRDLTPALAEIRGVLVDASERAFRDQRDPATGAAWQPLAAATLLGGLRQGKTRRGAWRAPTVRALQRRRILQVTGQLAASVQGQSGADYALAGSNKVYARIHQFGGEAGRKSARVHIPARPYLGLGETDAVEVLSILSRHLAGAL